MSLGSDREGRGQREEQERLFVTKDSDKDRGPIICGWKGCVRPGLQYPVADSCSMSGHGQQVQKQQCFPSGLLLFLFLCWFLFCLVGCLVGCCGVVVVCLCE